MLLDSIFRKYRRRKLTRQGYVTARQRSKAAREVAQFGNGEKNRPGWLIEGVFALLWLTAAASITYQRQYINHDYVLGQTVSRDVYSEVPFDYVNSRKTELKREQAARQVPFVYRVDKSAITRSVEAFRRIQDALIQQAQASLDNEEASDVDAELSADPRVRTLIRDFKEAGKLAPLLSIFTSGPKVETLLQLIRHTMMQGISTEKLEGTFHVGMTSEDMVYVADPRGRRSQRKISEIMTPDQAGEQVAERFKEQYPATEQEALRALEALVSRAVEPNINFDSEATEAARAQAAAEVEEVRESVQAGAPLLRRGEKVNTDDLERLLVHAIEVRARRTDGNTIRDAVVAVCLMLVLTLIFAYGLYLITPRTFSSVSALCMVGTLTLLQIILSRLAMDIYFMQYGSSVYLLAVIPLAFGPMLLALLMDVRTALWVGLFTAIVAAMQSFDSFPMFVSGAVTAFAGAVFVQNASKRFHMLRAGFAVAVAVSIVGTLHVVGNEMPLSVIPQLIGFALLNGVVTAMVASTVLPLFEYMFGVITNISLLELSDLNHPLLKRLQMEAPGTYHHSLLVATLAEQAATAIGANPLLARVCAYFHDIGKISQAEYFAENINLASGRNPHDELQPRMSSLIILNHVKGGLELAAKHKLKKVIREAIAQHHGSSLISYFYQRAREKEEAEVKKQKIEPQNYRYPGPPPTRKEIALISIADACEAAARALEKPTPQKIQQLVNRIVYGRIQDGQLDRADLTFRELAIGKATIASALGNMLHARVSYEKKAKDHDKHRVAKNDSGPAAQGSTEFAENSA